MGLAGFRLAERERERLAELAKKQAEATAQGEQKQPDQLATEEKKKRPYVRKPKPDNGAETPAE